MKHGSLFSGIGGFDWAAECAGIPTLWQVEINPFCRRVLEEHFPFAKRFEDIKSLNGGELDSVDIISGGFPCQPFSRARGARREGINDERYLWPEMERIVRKVRPSWVIVENVPGIDDQELVVDTISADMEAIGYQVGPALEIPAYCIGSPQMRERIWIVAHANRFRQQKRRRIERLSRKERIETHTCMQNDWPPRFGEIPGVPGMADGIPDRVDRVKAIGNSIVPHIAFEIFKTILFVEGQIA